MTGITQPSFTAPSAQKYVHDALATIGVQNRTSGTLSHALQVSTYYLSHSGGLMSTAVLLGLVARGNYMYNRVSTQMWQVSNKHLVQ